MVTVIADYLHFSNFSQLFGLPTKYFFNARQNCLTPETVSSVIHRKLQQKWRLILVACLQRKRSAFISSICDFFPHQQKSFSYTWYIAYISDINRFYMLLRNGHHCFLLILSQRTEWDRGDDSWNTSVFSAGFLRSGQENMLIRVLCMDLWDSIKQVEIATELLVLFHHWHLSAPLLESPQDWTLVK